MSLTNEDVDRFDSIMSTVMKRREDRGMNIPDRDEEKIAEILSQADWAAYVEHEKWLYSTEQFGSAVKPQASVKDGEDNRSFPNLDRYRNFTEDD